MLAELGNDLKKVLLAGVGAVAITAEKSEEVVRELVRRGELTIEQGKALNEELKHKMQENKKRAAQPEEIDVTRMTKAEREALKRRLEELEEQEDESAEG